MAAATAFSSFLDFLSTLEALLEPIFVVWMWGGMGDETRELAMLLVYGPDARAIQNSCGQKDLIGIAASK